MPRSEAKAIFDLIKPLGKRQAKFIMVIAESISLALSIDSKLFVEIMGSYRR
jgi:hypothetical protein